MIDEIFLQKVLDEFKKLNIQTNINIKILSRPPFSFLHKLLVELLRVDNIFTEKQLESNLLITKDDKASFLIRALAFVTFALENEENEKHISILLLVSPTKILSGLEVSRTNIFLHQLARVCVINNIENRKKAATQVLHKGDRVLYTYAVTFRQGFIKAQALAKGFVCRLNKKKSKISIQTHNIENNKINGPSLEESQTKDSNHIQKQVEIGQRNDGENDSEIENDKENRNRNENENENKNKNKKSPVGKNKNNYVVGTEFYKDFGASDLYKGKIKGYENNKYCCVLENDQEEKINENEMEALLKNTAQDAIEYIKRLENDRNVFSCQAVEEYRKNDPNISTETNATLQKAESLPNLMSPMTTINSSLQRISSVSPLPLPAIIVPGGMDEWKKRLKINSSSTPKVKPLVKKTVDENKTSTKIKKEKNITDIDSNIKKKDKFKKVKSFLATDSPFNDSNNNIDKFDQEVNIFLSKESNIISEEKKHFFEDIVNRINSYLKRRHLRVIDLFRYTDTDDNGYVTATEMCNVLSQLEIHLSLKDVKEFVAYIDRDQNGVVDIDEFESLIRNSKRNAILKEQLQNDLLSSQTGKNPLKKSKKFNDKYKFKIMIKHKQRLYDTFHALDIYENGTINSMDFRAAIYRLKLKDVNEKVINDLLLNSKSPHQQGLIDLEELKKLLDNESNVRKENKFLNEKWLHQFDSHLNRVLREHDME